MKWNDSSRSIVLRMGNIDMVLKIIATVLDISIMLCLAAGQRKTNNRISDLGYLNTYLIFAVNVIAIWR